MAHFLKPAAAPAGNYDVTDSLAPGSVWCMRVPLAGRGDIALWGGGGFWYRSTNSTVVPKEKITERPEGDRRILSLFGQSLGTTTLEVGQGSNAWISLRVQVTPPVKDRNAMEPIRGALIRKIQDDTEQKCLKWNTVILKGGVAIEVCHPVYIGDRYVPVTSDESMSFARRFGAYPLTRAVCDQVYNQSTKVAYQYQPELYDFEKYTGYLVPKYKPDLDKPPLVFGAHKLWILSVFGKPSKRFSINYGFYNPTPKGKVSSGGPNLLSAYSVTQSLGQRHDGGHWDYSQLLQLMRFKGPLMVNGRLMSMGRALVEGLPALWDEPTTLSYDELPW